MGRRGFGLQGGDGKGEKPGNSFGEPPTETKVEQRRKVEQKTKASDPMRRVVNQAVGRI
jgi:hypothetical protein